MKETEQSLELETSGERRRGGRPSAGTDPRKRRQILDGAAKVFSATGFDAASMSDVAREAGVSKATLYVYYPSKEELFVAVVGEERDRSVGTVLAHLDPDRPLAEVLGALGMALLQLIARPRVIRAHRVVIGVVERMPEVGRQMYEGGPRRIYQALATHLGKRDAAGEVAIDDCEQAAVQFLELCQAGIVRPRLYAVVEGDPSEAECAKAVGAAVAMFMARYGKGPVA